jgi:hypothetical protein
MLTKGQRLAAAAAAALAEESFEPEPEAEGEVAGGSGGGRRGKSKKKGTRYRRPNSNCKGTASCSSRTAKKSSSINLSPSTSAKKGKRYKKGGSNPTTDEQQRPTSERRAHAASSTEAGNHTATNATSNKATISPDVDGGDDVIEGVATTPKKTWSDLSIRQLKPYLQKYKLAVSGRKAQLIERLEKYGTGPEDCVDAPPPGQDT